MLNYQIWQEHALAKHQERQSNYLCNIKKPNYFSSKVIKSRIRLKYRHKMTANCPHITIICPKLLFVLKNSLQEELCSNVQILATNDVSNQDHKSTWHTTNTSLFLYKVFRVRLHLLQRKLPIQAET